MLAVGQRDKVGHDLNVDLTIATDQRLQCVVQARNFSGGQGRLCRLTKLWHVPGCQTNTGESSAHGKLGSGTKPAPML